MVTGAAGFIGQRLIARWPIADHILGVDLLPFRPQRSDVSVVSLDVLDQHQMERLVAQVRPHLIIHLAAISSRTDPRSADSIIGYNAALTASVLRAAVAGGKVPVMLACSGAEYGDIQPHDPRPREDAILRPDDAYAVSKVVSAMTAIGFGKIYNLPVQVFRFANVYGPGQKVPKIIPNIVDRVIHGEKIILKKHGTPTRPWIFVDDLIEAIGYFWYNLPCGEICNLVTDEEITMRQLAGIVITHLQARLPSLASKSIDDFITLSDESGGTQRVTMSGWKMRRLRFQSKIPLQVGIGITVDHLLQEKVLEISAASNS